MRVEFFAELCRDITTRQGNSNRQENCGVIALPSMSEVEAQRISVGVCQSSCDFYFNHSSAL